MKFYSVFFVALFCHLNGFCQQNDGTPVTSGKIVFEQFTKMIIVSSGDETEEQLKSIPKESKKTMDLIFNQTASLYCLSETKDMDEGPKTTVDDNGNVTLKMGSKKSQEIIYTDLVNKKSSCQREFFFRNFLIEEDLSNFNWKLTGQQKTILGYTCMQAEFVKNDKTTTAWFTPQIPVPSGPAGFGNLPGLILSLSYNNGDDRYTAISIDTKTSIEPIVNKTEGKKVTHDEFAKIREDKFKEISSMGAGGTINIKM